MTESSFGQYADELREVLEFRDIPMEAIEQIVREVESHVAESGEDPLIEFGSPDEYANNFAPRSRMVWFWALVASSVVLASGGAYVLISGIFGLLSSSATLWDLPPWARIVIGALGISAFCTLVLVAGVRSRRRSSLWRIQTGKAGLP